MRMLETKWNVHYCRNSLCCDFWAAADPAGAVAAAGGGGNNAGGLRDLARGPHDLAWGPRGVAQGSRRDPFSFCQQSVFNHMLHMLCHCIFMFGFP